MANLSTSLDKHAMQSNAQNPESSRVDVRFEELTRAYESGQTLDLRGARAGLRASELEELDQRLDRFFAGASRRRFNAAAYQRSGLPGIVADAVKRDERTRHENS